MTHERGEAAANAGSHPEDPPLRAQFEAYDTAPVERLQPTCACFLAPDLAVETDVARALLELRRARDELVRVDLKSQIEVPAVRGVLSEGDVESLRRFEGPLFVYLPVDRVGEAATALPGMAVALAAMLSIYERVFFRQEDRLRIAYQAAVQELRRAPRAEWAVGALGLRLLTGAEREALEAFVGADGAYEQVFVRLSTQLRVLLEFALRFAGGAAEDPRPLPLAELVRAPLELQPRLIRRLGVILQDGIETPPSLRRGVMRELFGDRSHRMWPAASRHLPELVSWLAEKHVAWGRAQRRPQGDAVSPYSMCAWGALRELDRDRFDATDLAEFSRGLFPGREQAWLRMERVSRIGTHVRIPVF